MNEQRAVAVVLGPVDRVHFLDEQRRNRRASWRFSLFAAVSAALSGLPLSILLSPLLFGLMLLIIHGINLVSPGPTGVRRPTHDAVSEHVAQATLKQWMEFIGWSTLAVFQVTACVAFNLLTMSLLLWGVWSMLQFAFGT